MLAGRSQMEADELVAGMIWDDAMADVIQANRRDTKKKPATKTVKSA